MQVWRIYHLNSFVRIIGYVGDVVQSLMKKFRYVGRTSQRLQQRITQHVPKSVRGVHTFQDRTSLARSCKPIKSLNTEISSSAIGQHLLHNQLCAQNYSDDKFSILAHGRTAFHLLTLEATYIKTSKPNLCKQKEFVYSLKISH